MDFILVVIGLVAIALLVRVTHLLERQNEVTKAVVDEIRELRLKSRARIAQTGVKATDPDKLEVDMLRRHGRSTYGKRVVVGGDPDSPQHQDLARAVNDDDD